MTSKVWVAGIFAVGLAVFACGQPFTVVSSLAIDPVAPDVVYAGSSAGVFRSADAGARWSPTTLLSRTLSIAADPTHPAIYAGAADGFHRTLDGGANWSLAGGLLTNTSVGQVAVDRSGAFVYAGAVLLSQPLVQTLGILRSADQGVTWQRTGLTDFSVTALAAGASAPGVLYAAGYRSAPSSYAILRSGDAGDTWSTIAGPGDVRYDALAPDPADPSTLYAVSGFYVYKTVDGGATWTVTLTGGIGSVLVFDPADHAKLDLATDRGVFQSADAGRTWSLLARGPQTALASLIVGPRGIFAGLGLSIDNAPTTGPFQVFRSADGGRTWLGSSLLGSAVCAPDSRILCLSAGRFDVRVFWFYTGRPLEYIAAYSVPLRAETGSFAFFDLENLDVVVKVLDGRAVNGYHWVFVGGLTNVLYTLTVSDLQTGAFWTYLNPNGQLASVADTAAF